MDGSAEYTDLGNFALEEVDDVESIATQSLFFKREVYTEEKTERFATPVAENELNQIARSGVPRKTMENNKFALNIWTSGASHRNSINQNLLEQYNVVPISLSNISENELYFWMCRFIVEIRRKDGTPYPPNTLYNITSGIQRYLRLECNRPEISFFDKNKPQFSEFRRILDAKMKQLSAEGRGVVTHRGEITEDDEFRLWETGSIGLSTSQGLINGVFFYNCKLFGFRGMEEHRRAQAEQFSISFNQHNTKVLTFQEHASKTMQGGLNQRKMQPRCIRQHADPTNLRDVVALYEKYLSKIPSVDPFYRRAILFTREPKYSAQVVGTNKLGQFMKDMFVKAKIDITDRNISNHSGQVFCCTSLYNKGFSDQEISARSGHRSEAIRLYKRPSEEMLKDVSDALQPPKNLKTEIITKNAADKIIRNDENNNQSNDEESTLRIVLPKSVKSVIIQSGEKEVKISI